MSDFWVLVLAVMVFVGFVGLVAWSDYRNRKRWNGIAEFMYRGRVIREEHERLKRDHLEAP